MHSSSDEHAAAMVVVCKGGMNDNGASHFQPTVTTSIQLEISSFTPRRDACDVRL